MRSATSILTVSRTISIMTFDVTLLPTTTQVIGGHHQDTVMYMYFTTYSLTKGCDSGIFTLDGSDL